MRFLLSLMLIGSTLSDNACGHFSCLECSDNATCNLCNQKFNYLNDGDGHCFLHYEENCTLKDSDGSCITCNSGFQPYKSTCRASPNTSSTCLRVDCNDLCYRCPTGKIYNNGVCSDPTGNQSVPSNCSYADVNSLCLECVKSYFLFKGRCYSPPTDCIVPTVCSKCANNSFITPWDATKIKTGFWDNYVNLDLTSIFSVDTSGCKENTDPGCKVAFSPTKCKHCSDGYYLNSNFVCTTTPQADNCIERNLDRECTACVQGFYFDTTSKTCISARTKDPNCRTYLDAVFCLVCIPPYYLTSTTNFASNQCIAVPDAKKASGCYEYGISGDCLFCDSSNGLKELDTSTTPPTCKPKTATTTPNCASYNNDYVCTWCDDGYKLTSTNNCFGPVDPALNCNQFNKDGACIQCASNYFLNSSGQCLPRRITNCAVYSAPGVCLYCDLGFYVLNQVCTASSTVNQIAGSYKEHCLYSDYNKCVFCKKNFNLVAGFCKYTSIENCEAYKAFEGGQKCTYCHAGYYYDEANNECVKVTTPFPYCERLMKQGSDIICLHCDESRVPSSDGKSCDVPTGSFEKVIRCQNYDSAGKCIRCRQGMDLITDGNGPGKNSCEFPAQTFDICCEYLENGNCVECITSGYFTGTDCAKRSFETDYCSVYKDGVCVQCQSDSNSKYYLFTNTDTGEVTCQPSTATYDVQTCFIGGQNKCDTCGSSTIPLNNVCTAITDVTNCSAYAPDPNTCTVCNNGYLASNSCVPATLPSNCVALSAPSGTSSTPTCSRCNNLTYLAGTQCIAKDTLPNCIKYSTLFHCDICVANYYPNTATGQCDSKTATVDPVCQRLDSSQVCTRCDANTFLKTTDETCGSIASGVLNCTELLTQFSCKICAQDYLLNTTSGLCDAILAGNKIDGCALYATTTTCSVCKTNYALTDDSMMCIPDCLDASGTKEQPVCDLCLNDKLWDTSPKACKDLSLFGLQAIVGCDVHKKVGTTLICAKCENNNLLSADQTTCTLIQGMSKCEIVDASAPKCALCVSGKTLDSTGACVAGSGGDPLCWLAESNYPEIKDGVTPTFGTCGVCDMNKAHENTSGVCESNGLATLDKMNSDAASWKVPA